MAGIHKKTFTSDPKTRNRALADFLNVCIENNTNRQTENLGTNPVVYSSFPSFCHVEMNLHVMIGIVQYDNLLLTQAMLTPTLLRILNE